MSVKRGQKPSVRSRSGILTNAATTGSPPNTVQSRAINRPPGAGGGTTPAVVAAQRPQSRAINRPTTQTSRTNVGPSMQQLSGGTPTGYTAANFKRPLQNAATDTRLTAPPTADELMGQRYGRAAEVYADPVTGAATPAYEAAQAAPTFGTPGAMGGPADTSGGFGLPPDNEFFRMLADLESDEARAQKGFDMGLIDQPALDALFAQETMNINAPEFQWNPGVGAAGNQIGLAGGGPVGGGPVGGGPVGGGPVGGGPVGGGLGGGTIEDAYVDMYADLRDDAQTAYDTSGDFYTTEGILGRGHWSGVEDRANQYWDDRGAAAEGYFGGMRDDQLEYLALQAIYRIQVA